MEVSNIKRDFKVSELSKTANLQKASFLYAMKEMFLSWGNLVTKQQKKRKLREKKDNNIRKQEFTARLAAL